MKIRRKGDERLLYRTGEREGHLARIWNIPNGHELVGFHAGMNANDEIVYLGIVTRIAIFPSICFEAVDNIKEGVDAINGLSSALSGMNTDMQG